MGFLNTNSMPRLVEKLADGDNIKITGNSKGNRVGTVIKKIVEKADDVTKAVEQEVVNDSYSFKIGTGDVNVSADVQDGFGEIGIKGVTYQNLLGTLVAVGEEWVESDNKYTLNLPSGSGQPQIRYNLAYPLKPNTKYTIICEIKEYTVGYPHFCFMTKDNRTLASTTEFTPNSVGIKTAILTTKSDVNAELLRILPRNNTDNIYSIGKNIILLEGDHTNNPNLPSYFEGIVGVGDKSKNLLNEKTMVIGGVNSSTGEFVTDDTRKRSDYIPFEGNNPFVSINSDSLFFYDVNKTYISRIATVNGTSPANAKYVVVRAFKDSTNIQLQYGSVVTEYQPYGTHKIEILSNGKNLLNPLIQLPFNIIKGNFSNGNDGKVLSIVKVKPNTKYIMSVNRSETKGRIVAKMSNRLLSSSDLNGNPFDQSNIYNFLLKNYANGRKFEYQCANLNEVSFTTLDDCNYIYINIDNAHGAINNGEIVTTIRWVQLEEVNNNQNTPSTYEPYKEDKTQILLDEPLMRLPNGVCDEITRDGKLIKRIGKVILDGSESWVQNQGFSNDEYIVMYTAKINKFNVIECEKISNCIEINTYPSNSYNYECMNFEYIHNSKTAAAIYLRLKASSTDEFIAKVKNNPITIYYELAEPIITEIPSSYVRYFKDGHLTFNTLVAPESTHLVQLNKSAQIERSIREVQSLDGRVEKLESFYDDIILENSHKLQLLDMDFNYVRNMEDI